VGGGPDGPLRDLPQPKDCAGEARARNAVTRYVTPGKKVADTRMKIVLPQRGWLFDLDGTVYRGSALIPGADATIAALRAAGRRVAFLSNKPLQTRHDYARKLTALGVPTTSDDVVNSSLVLARHLALLDPGAPVFVIGE